MLIARTTRLKPDPTIANPPVVLPPPYRNPEWPQPGGYASNAMYHLDAPGPPARRSGSQDAGKGSDTNSRLTASPVVGGGRIYALDSEAHVYVFRRQRRPRSLGQAAGAQERHRHAHPVGPAGQAQHHRPASGMGGGVAYDDGKIFVTSGFGVLHLHGRAQRARDLAAGHGHAHHQRARWSMAGGFSSPPTTIISTPWPKPTAARLWDHQGIAGIGRHPGLHQRGGVGRIRDRALYFGRALCAAGAERPGGLERCAVPFRPRHGACPSWTTSPGGR